MMMVSVMPQAHFLVIVSVHIDAQKVIMYFDTTIN